MEQRTIDEEVYKVFMKKENSVRLRDFDNFETAYEFFRMNKENYIAGNIQHIYRVTETFYEFNKREENK